jgi:Zn-dependent protease
MLWSALLMAALVATTLAHELAHCFAARAAGGHADEILLWPLGGLSYVGHRGTPREDIRVAAAGPLVHVPLAGIAAGGLALAGFWDWGLLNPLGSWAPFQPFEAHFGANLAVGVLKLQVVLFLFNLLVPAYPLDGGRILANLLVLRHGRERAAAILSYVSTPVGVALLLWGLLQQNFLLAFTGVWVIFESLQIRRLARLGEVHAHPMFAEVSEFDYLPEGPSRRRKGWLARWRERRAQRRALRRREREDRERAEVDAILEKVSRQGIGALTARERRILEEASRRRRGGV